MEIYNTDVVMVAYVYKRLGASESNVQEALTALRTWLDKQPHLPKQIDDVRLEGIYINCKCSLERTKRSIDAYFSLKTTFPELLSKRDPTSPELQSCKKFLKHFSMPKLTPEGHRVLVTTEIPPDASQLRPDAFFKLVLLWSEVMLAEDRSLGDIIIIDLRNLDVGHVLKIRANLVRASEIIYREAYCRRVKAVHFLNAPKVMDMLLSLCKVAVPEKIRKRITVHLPGSDTLFQYVPREFVPNEMGGSGGKLDDLHEASWRLLCGYRDWLLQQDELQVDESRRPAESRRPDDLYGLDGSFRKLDID